ncbi:ABC transporter ATP-binding protein [Nitriliruptoraceae bacterium ZYF776]|nr:ABC transporter ATP-binding protein [Profundirhabdus halotolerans]
MRSLFEVESLHVHYGASHIVRGIDLTVERGQVVAVFGRNGVGKTTLLHAIAGLTKPSSGSIVLDGVPLAGRPAHIIARAGIALVPQGRRVMGSLTVEENLRLATLAPSADTEHPWTLELVYDLLPRLHDRRALGAKNLSGGEQQMLTIGRALLRNPRLVFMDEPSEGLAPIVIEEIARLCAKLRERSVSFVIVEQNLGLGLSVADEVVVIDHGEVVFRDSAHAFRGDRARAERLLGIV